MAVKIKEGVNPAESFNPPVAQISKEFAPLKPITSARDVQQVFSNILSQVATGITMDQINQMMQNRIKLEITERDRDDARKGDVLEKRAQLEESTEKEKKAEEREEAKEDILERMAEKEIAEEAALREEVQQQLAEEIEKRLPENEEKVKERIDDLAFIIEGTGLLESVEDIRESIRESDMEAVKEAVEELAEEKIRISEVNEAISDTVKEMVDNGIGVGGLSDSLKELAKQDKGDLQNELEELSKEIEGLAGEITEMTEEDKDRLGDMIDGLVGRIEDIADREKGKLGEELEDFSKELEELSKDIKEMKEEDRDGISEEIEELAGKIEDLADEEKGPLGKELEDLGEALKALSGEIGEMTEEDKDGLTGEIEDITERIEDIADKEKGKLGEELEDLGEALKALSGKITEMTEEDKDRLGDMIDGLVGRIEDIIDKEKGPLAEDLGGLSKELKELSGEIKGLGKEDAIGRVKDFVNKHSEELNALKDVEKLLDNWNKLSPKEIKQKLKDLSDKIRKTTETLEKSAEELKRLVSDPDDFIKTAKKLFSEDKETLDAIRRTWINSIIDFAKEMAIQSEQKEKESEKRKGAVETASLRKEKEFWKESSRKIGDARNKSLDDFNRRLAEIFRGKSKELQEARTGADEAVINHVESIVDNLKRGRYADRLREIAGVAEELQRTQKKLSKGAEELRRAMPVPQEFVKKAGELFAGDKKTLGEIRKAWAGAVIDFTKEMIIQSDQRKEREEKKFWRDTSAKVVGVRNDPIEDFRRKFAEMLKERPKDLKKADEMGAKAVISRIESMADDMKIAHIDVVGKMSNLEEKKMMETPLERIAEELRMVAKKAEALLEQARKGDLKGIFDELGKPTGDMGIVGRITTRNLDRCSNRTKKEMIKALLHQTYIINGTTALMEGLKSAQDRKDYDKVDEISDAIEQRVKAVMGAKREMPAIMRLSKAGRRKGIAKLCARILFTRRSVVSK